MSRRVPPPTEEQIAQTIADLDSIGAPLDITGIAASHTLRAEGIRCGTSRASIAARQRRGTGQAARPATGPNAKGVGHCAKILEAARSLATPELIGAACTGQWPMFDAEIYGERDRDAHARIKSARQLCLTCPVLSACEQARQALPRHAVLGVWAGQVYGRKTPA